MKNRILKMVYDNMGSEAISFTIITDKNVKIITFKSSNEDDYGKVKSQSILDSYVMVNNDDSNLIELIELDKERAVSCEEISQKKLEYSIKLLCRKQLNYMLSQ